MTGNLKLLINFVWKFIGTVRFGNDHVAAIMGFGDLQWGNILITRVYFVERLGHNLFLVGQFCDSDLEVTFRRNACFVRNLKGVDLLKGDRSTNLYTINLHEMASASPSHGINGKRYVLVIVDDYSRYTWVHFLKSKDEAPEVIIKFLKRITVLLQSPVIIIRTNNGTEFKNQVLKEYFDTVGISHQMSSVRTSQQNEVVERRNRTLVEAARTMLIFSLAPLFLWAEAIATACFTQNRSIIYRRFNKTPYELINGRKPDISFLHVFGALCYTKNDREDIGKLGAKGDIEFFIGYSADSYAYRVYNCRTKKIIETMNVSFDELSAMDFEQRNTAPIPTNSSSHATNVPITSQAVDELNPNAMVDGDTKQKAKVSFKEIQMTYRPKISKPKNVGTHEILATPKPRKPRFLLRWSPTGKMFDQDGKLVIPSNSKNHVDCSNGYPDLFVVCRFRLFQAHDGKSKASHQFRLEVYGNCPLQE
nr:retrovirus-related Pol polyprotein from transposon TNT 1-94 [Tanacetum cinerariifolium]